MGCQPAPRPWLLRKLGVALYSGRWSLLVTRNTECPREREQGSPSVWLLLFRCLKVHSQHQVEQRRGAGFSSDEKLRGDGGGASHRGRAPDRVLPCFKQPHTGTGPWAMPVTDLVYLPVCLFLALHPFSLPSLPHPSLLSFFSFLKKDFAKRHSVCPS